MIEPGLDLPGRIRYQLPGNSGSTILTARFRPARRKRVASYRLGPPHLPPVSGRRSAIVSRRSGNEWPVPFVSGRATFVLAALALEASGCNLAPRQEVDECHRLSQTLRSENAGLRDQMLVLRSQNQDFSERAVDDARRIAQLETSNEQLETSVQAYQDERTRLETAYKQLRASLPGSLRPISSNQEGGRQLASPRESSAAGSAD